MYMLHYLVVRPMEECIGACVYAVIVCVCIYMYVGCYILMYVCLYLVLPRMPLHFWFTRRPICVMFQSVLCMHLCMYTQACMRAYMHTCMTGTRPLCHVCCYRVCMLAFMYASMFHIAFSSMYDVSKCVLSHTPSYVSMVWAGGSSTHVPHSSSCAIHMISGIQGGDHTRSYAWYTYVCIHGQMCMSAYTTFVHACAFRHTIVFGRRIQIHSEERANKSTLVFVYRHIYVEDCAQASNCFLWSEGFVSLRKGVPAWTHTRTYLRLSP